MIASLDSKLHKMSKVIDFLSVHKVINYAKKFKGQLQLLFIATFINDHENRTSPLFVFWFLKFIINFLTTIQI